MKGIRLLSLLAAAFLSAACGSKSVRTPAPQTRQFPMALVPTAISDDAMRLSYMADHYWDEFFKPVPENVWLRDSTHTEGVGDEELEQNVGNYVTFLSYIPVSEAQNDVDRFFTQLETFQKADTASNAFSKLVSLICRYLYDPNSPARNEDLYLPFVKRLASSSLTDPAMRPIYEYEAKLCSMNRYGTPAADFTFTDLAGRVRSLYSVKAEWTLLFFSNPGCPSCRHIIEALEKDAHVTEMISDGRLAVVNVYIDQDLPEWKAYAGNYPADWYTGYDQSYKIRTDQSYNVRAIPSLYLLDSEKKVLMKDAPEEKVIAAIDNLH